MLVYSDSLSWGIIPATRKRLPFEARWPGVMEIALTDQRHSVRVIEDCLNGRRTVWEDPFKPGRNGLAGLAQRIEVNSPLSLVMLMLGTGNAHTADPGGSVTPASTVDGIHLDADQHQTLGKALARFVSALPGVLPPATT